MVLGRFRPSRGLPRLSFSVRDLEGSPLSHIIVNESTLGPQCGIFLQMLDSEPLASVRQGPKP